MPPSLRRALACALSASLALTPCTAVFAQKGPKADAKAPAKADAKAPKADPKADKADAKAPKKKPTKADRDKAKAAFKRGEEKMAASDYAAAADAYKEANDTIPSAQAYYKLAFALDKAGKGAQATEAYRAFLDFPPPDKMAEQKTLAEGRVKELSVGTVKLTSTPPGANVNVDGQPAAGPTPITLSLKPGSHTLELSAPNFEPASRELVVSAGASVDVSVPLKEIPPPPPPPATTTAPPVATAPPPTATEPAKPGSKVPAYVTLGLAGAGAVVGTIFGLKALSSKGDFDDKPTTSNADDAERNALIADMAFGVAITLGITGTVLLLSGNKKSEPAKTGKLRLLPMVTPQTQGAAAVLRFLAL